jgi:hypothetical protein
MPPIAVEDNEDHVYLSEDTLDSGGRLLCPLPSKPFRRADIEYAEGKTLTFTRFGEREAVVVEIVEHLEVGYGDCPQILLAKVQDGLPKYKGRTVVVKVYDALYVNPDYVFTECPSGTLPFFACKDFILKLQIL